MKVGENERYGKTPRALRNVKTRNLYRVLSNVQEFLLTKP